MANVGTLKELDLKPGDEVECVNGPLFGGEWTAGKRYKMTDRGLPCDRNGTQTSSLSTFRLISRATPQPKLWRDMTAEEKGGLLLAAHERKVIEWSYGLPWVTRNSSATSIAAWDDECAYRIRQEPKVETVALCWRHDVGTVKNKIGTIDIIDGKPDCSSIKMEKLG